MRSKRELGVWYWLDAGPQEEWEEDVKEMRYLEYDYVVASKMDLITNRNEEGIEEFINTCYKNGLSVYLCIWSGMLMYPFIGGRINQQVDEKGNRRDYYNLWNERWRKNFYKKYLQDIVSKYVDTPGLRGYLFDDTFASVAKQPGQGTYISYSQEDIKRFREYMKNRYGDISVIHLLWREQRGKGWKEILPPRSPDEPFWLDWYEARATWYEEWAKDTVSFIKEVDPHCELYILDGAGIAANQREYYGIDFQRVARYFDVVMLYAMPAGFEKPPIKMKPILSHIDFMVRSVRNLVTQDKKVSFCFHIYQPFDNKNFDRVSSYPYPDIKQIKDMTTQAFFSGADMVEHYGYRIGNWRLKDISPGKPFPEVKTMLKYRKNLWEDLKKFNREVKHSI